MAGRAAMRTPEPPDRDERGDSPPRLARPKRTTRPPNNYAREQEIDTDRRKTRSQQKERIELGDRRDEATSDDAATEREELDVGGLVREIAKLRREMRLRDEIHNEEIQRTREQFGAALAEVRHELQSLTNRNTTPQCHSETAYARKSVYPLLQALLPTQMSRALRRQVTQATYGPFQR
ncbi:unnamed protein product [Penicillium salamii]|nr:unnamed protein product [Penicillium salamii]CAG8275829.1 unnamed protein product [Penicillium salamii]